MRRVIWSGVTVALIVLTACTSSPASRLAQSPGPVTTAQPPTTSTAASVSPIPTRASVSPIPTKPLETKPIVATWIKVYGDCRTPRFEPKEIVMTCADYGVRFENLHWLSWTARRATGVGTLLYNDCTPSCAEGHFHQIRNDRVTLTDPVRGAGGQIVWSKLQAAQWEPGYDTGPLHGGPSPLPTQPE
jgi:hypothetical protein